MRKLTTTLATLTALGMTVPAMGQNINDDNVDLDIDVVVEEIAYLEVVNASGSMVIDHNGDSFMGNPSSDGDVFDTAGGTLATIQLNTNFDIDAIRVDFPRVSGGTGGIRNFSSATYFGEAIGAANGNTLGVWPQIGYLVGGAINGGGGGIYGHSGNNTALDITGPHRTDNPNDGFGSGTHNFALGVSTKWDRTLEGQPEFAEPDTYEIQLTATIVPTL